MRVTQWETPFLVTHELSKQDINTEKVTATAKWLSENFQHVKHIKHEYLSQFSPRRRREWHKPLARIILLTLKII